MKVFSIFSLSRASQLVIEAESSLPDTVLSSVLISISVFPLIAGQHRATIHEEWILSLYQYYRASYSLLANVFRSLGEVVRFHVSAHNLADPSVQKCQETTLPYGSARGVGREVLGA